MTKTRINNAFTIVELLVAMSLLVILLGLSGMVFNTTVAAHRAAGASIDVSRNLRAITEQLNADFDSLQKDAPLTIWFEQQWYDTDGDTIQDIDELVRFDQVQFFADDVFQTTKLYDMDGDIMTPPDSIIYGNMARVYYGHAWDVDFSQLVTQRGYRRFSIANGDAIDLEPASILARRIHISTNNAFLLPANPDFNFPIDPTTNQYSSRFAPPSNNYLEYDNYATLALWKQLLTFQANCDQYLNVCFNNTMPPGNSTLAGRPVVDLDNIDFLHNLLSQGILQMRIQWAYTVEDLSRTILLTTPILPADADYFTGVRWWPSEDPAGDSTVDSDFNTMGSQFGVYLEMPGGSIYVEWFDIISAAPAKRCKTDNGAGVDLYFKDDFYPKALKFTFVFKDSNGVFADGKTFTHIVYIDN